MNEYATFNTTKEARRAAKDYVAMLYREDLCIRDTVNCKTSGDWSFQPGSTGAGQTKKYHALCEYWQPSEDPRSQGRPQFHRIILTSADVERLNGHMAER